MGEVVKNEAYNEEPIDERNCFVRGLKVDGEYPKQNWMEKWISSLWGRSDEW